MDLQGYTAVGKVEEFRDGQGRAVLVEGKRVAVFRRDQEWFAIQDACPHMGASLAVEGFLIRDFVICRWHDKRFHLVTGESDMRSGVCARIYQVSIDNGTVHVKPPAPKQPVDNDEDEDWARYRID